MAIYFSVLILCAASSPVRSSAQQATDSTGASAAEARTRCDTLAAHPRDPARYLAGVPDEQIAPGPAIEACEAATRLNPDEPRLWFQLGRAYRSVRRDQDAFKAFVEAARRNHAAAKKYLGDAYLEGRGLPPGEHQDAQRALELYKQSAEGRFDDATAAVREVEAAIARQTQQAEQAQEEAERNRFDPSIFQNQKIMAALYYANKDIRILRGNTYANLYISGLWHELSEKVIFLEGGAECKPLVSGLATSRNLQDLVDSNMLLGRPGSLNTEDVVRAGNEGNNDMLTLFNRYHCKSDVTKTILSNINAVYGVGEIRPGTSQSPSQPVNAGPRAWLGVALSNVDPRLAGQLGLNPPAGTMLKKVYGAPAQAAGLQNADVIIAMNGAPVADSGDFVRKIAAMRPDTFITLTVLQNGNRRDVPVKLGTQPSAEELDRLNDWALSDDCTELLRKWQRTRGHGAFAVSQGGACGWSSETNDRAAARANAMQACANEGANCRIKFEK